jgi:hypothetical protein
LCSQCLSGPKRGQSSYFIFQQDPAQKAKAKAVSDLGVVLLLISLPIQMEGDEKMPTKLSKLWNTLSAEEKKPYEDQAKADQTAAKEKKTDWERKSVRLRVNALSWLTICVVAQKRQALVIGNAKYPKGSGNNPLPSALIDAAEVKTALTSLDWIVTHVTDCTKDGLSAAVDTFVKGS